MVHERYWDVVSVPFFEEDWSSEAEVVWFGAMAGMAWLPLGTAW